MRRQKALRALLVLAALLITIKGDAQRYAPDAYIDVLKAHFDTIPIPFAPWPCDPIIIELTPGGSAACAEVLNDTIGTQATIDALMSGAVDVHPVTEWVKSSPEWSSRAYLTSFGDSLVIYLYRPSDLLRLTLIVTVVGYE